MFEEIDGLVYKDGQLMLPSYYASVSIFDLVTDIKKDHLEQVENLQNMLPLKTYKLNTDCRIIDVCIITAIQTPGSNENNTKLVGLYERSAVAVTVSPYRLYTIEQLHQLNSVAVATLLNNMSKQNNKLTIQNDFVKELFSKLKFDTIHGE